LPRCGAESFAFPGAKKIFETMPLWWAREAQPQEKQVSARKGEAFPHWTAAEPHE